ncbi:MAG: MauE/DoxX family redox-associated membrane protein [Limisphaerales bacterium]
MNALIEQNIRVALRWVLGVIFVWAAISKIAIVQDFFSSLAAYKLPLPVFFLQSVAIVLPWLELFCGLMLIAGLWLRAAASWVFLLCLAFVVCTGQAWGRGLNISCGCLNLDFLGDHPSLLAMLESVGFAFFRGLILTLASFWLLRSLFQALDHQPATVPAPSW